MAGPSFPALAQANLSTSLSSISFAANPNNTCYIAFLGLPSNDILPTAATILITNSPQAVANVIEHLNKPEMNWDTSNAHAGYSVNTDIVDLQEMFKAAVVDIVLSNSSNETLNKVKDLQRRQQELEASLKNTKELLHVVAKRTQQQESQQKNSPGSPSAQRPGQLKPNDKKPPNSKRLGHKIWTPSATPAVTDNRNMKPTSKVQTDGSEKPSSKVKPTKEEAKQDAKPSKKKRKFRKTTK
eukprot:CAMPEP_0172418294 /NCGR_PEP_ID=MMETSP1064-20121228/4812_1 /TAXON_ID=202472 /ORGANISM="Aulacoseira subarctica , Strain CCAP 1002/5" /LENGTH=240 /DNA_ID=CAMNT_0013157179 /DNA_START=203 /DNA_END=927 /DNA_ORIENTATION=+